jgi:hypothetical protein
VPCSWAPLAERIQGFDVFQRQAENGAARNAPTPSAQPGAQRAVPAAVNTARQIGLEDTWAQFNRAMGRAVSAETALRDKPDGDFEQARNHSFKHQQMKSSSYDH